MKKLFITMLVVLIVPACVFAARGMVDLTVSGVAESTYDIETVKEAIEGDGEFNFSVDNLGFGVGTELKVAFAALDARAIYSPAQKTISGTVSANIALDIFFVRVKAGLGCEYNYNFDTKYFGFGNANGVADASNGYDFKKAALDACVGVDVLLGKLTVGAHASLPTAVTIEKENWVKLIDTISDNWQFAKLGVSVGYSFL